MKAKKTRVRAKWYIPQGTEGDDVCCDLTATIGIAITGKPGNLLWFVEEDQGAAGMRIVSHGTAETLTKAKKDSLASARWILGVRNL